MEGLYASRDWKGHQGAAEAWSSQALGGLGLGFEKIHTGGKARKTAWVDGCVCTSVCVWECGGGHGCVLLITVSLFMKHPFSGLGLDSLE